MRNAILWSGGVKKEFLIWGGHVGVVVEEGCRTRVVWIDF